MRRFILFLFLLLIVVAGAGMAFLAFWEVEPEVVTVEKIIPNDRFSQ